MMTPEERAIDLVAIFMGDEGGVKDLGRFEFADSAVINVTATNPVVDGNKLLVTLNRTRFEFSVRQVDDSTERHLLPNERCEANHEQAQT